MADGMYVAMSGAAARAEQLESVADNLANAQTPGFKASRPAFETFLADGGKDELAYTGAVDTGIDLRPGATQMTGRPTDVVPENGAFLAVGLEDGTVGYTRDGRLLVDSVGRLMSGRHLVLGADGAPVLLPPGATFSIDSKGTVMSEGREAGSLALVKLEGPVQRRGDSVLGPAVDKGGRAVPVVGTVRTGELELSNSGPLEAAVEMISAQRSYDTSMQALQTYRTLDQRASEVGRTR